MTARRLRPAAAARGLAAGRGLYGLVLLLRTRTVLHRLHGLTADPVEVAVLRVLGARHLAQALLTLAVPTAPVLQLGEATDLVHGASMIPLAALDARRRRAGLVEIAVAALFAGSTDLTRRPAPRTR